MSLKPLRTTNQLPFFAYAPLTTDSNTDTETNRRSRSAATPIIDIPIVISAPASIPIAYTNIVSGWKYVPIGEYDGILLLFQLQLLETDHLEKPFGCGWHGYTPDADADGEVKCLYGCRIMLFGSIGFGQVCVCCPCAALDFDPSVRCSHRKETRC
jgi:hypothetical protein